MHRLIRAVGAFFLVAATLIAAGAQAAPSQDAAQTYLVLYKGNSVAASAITAAGGTLVYSYNQIGVAIARSGSATFAADVAKDSRVEGAAATGRFATKLDADTAVDNSAPVVNIPAPGSDNLS